MSEVLPHQHRMTGQAIASLVGFPRHLSLFYMLTLLSKGNCLGGVIGLLAGSSALETHGPEGFRIVPFLPPSVDEHGILTFRNSSGILWYGTLDPKKRTRSAPMANV